MIGVDELGRLILSRPTQGTEVGEQIEYKDPGQVLNAAVIQGTEQAHSGRNGNFSIFNKVDFPNQPPSRDIAGLVTGTRHLVRV